MIGRELRALVVVLAGIAATGCAHALSQPMPELKGQLALKVLNEQPSKMNDMPLGVHQIPDTSRFWVALKTSLKDAGGEEKWKTKYHAGVGEARPLTGEGGWASDDGGPVRDVVGKNLRLAIDALLRDASGTLPRGTGRTVAIKTQWVWMKPFFESKAAVLEETEDTLVVVPDVMDGFVFAGVNILDKKSITATPADKK